MLRTLEGVKCVAAVDVQLSQFRLLQRLGLQHAQGLHWGKVDGSGLLLIESVEVVEEMTTVIICECAHA